MEDNVNIYKNPDIIQGQTDYHSMPGLSNSRLKLLRRSPALFKKAMEEGWEETTKKHHVEGDIIDKLLLNYPAFEAKYVEQTWETPSSENQLNFAHKVAGGMVPTKAYDESYASKISAAKLKEKANDLYDDLKPYIKHLANGDTRMPYPSSMKEMIMAIQSNAFAHPTLSKILNHPKKEHHKILTAELLGELFKCEVDLYLDLGKVVWNLDVKSTSQHLSSFPFDYRKYGYDKQQAIYYKIIRKNLDQAGRKDTKIRTGCIAVEKKMPFQAGMFEIHARQLVQGWQWARESTEIYKFHKKNGFTYPPRTIEKGMELITPYQFDLSLLAENNNDD